ncbi:MAG TPA: endonuclease/exonuclease/phosphatase family protein [Planctomycetota bacterium]|nr:endonuclease/exonuclease/phosphatase family protein [Planctomycetota bacterium]
MKNIQQYLYIALSMVAISTLYIVASWEQATYADNNAQQPRKLAVQEIPAPPPIPTKQQIEEQKKISILGWNVENLFQAHDVKTKLPKYDSANRNPKHVQQKLYNLSDILRRVNNGLGADIIGLCEVENEIILQELANHPNLQPLQYRYTYLKDSTDPRGIDTGIISRFPADEIRVRPMYVKGDGARFILQAKFKIHGHNLYVLVNHWRSQIGGRKQTEHRRIESAKICRNMVDKILQQEPHADIVLLGDFNEVPSDIAMRKYLGATLYQGKTTRAKLYNLTRTKKYDPWVKMTDSFDHIIISRGLLDNKGFYYKPNSFQFITFQFQCSPKGRPLVFSSQDGYGYSDHFPVYCELKWK